MQGESYGTARVRHDPIRTAVLLGAHADPRRSRTPKRYPRLGRHLEITKGLSSRPTFTYHITRMLCRASRLTSLE